MNGAVRNVAHIINCKPRTTDVAFDDSISFEDLRLKKPVLDGLREAGFEKPSPIQLKSIPLGKCGFDLVVQAKSGTGKTCVFAVLILENLITSIDSLQALVLAPTREIAVQIWEVITRVGKYMPDLKCHAFIGGMSVEEDKKNLKTCHIAIATPGRMKHLMEQEVTGFEHVRFLVLDEADRLLDSSFKENIIWIYKQLPASKQMLTLSATYPESLAQHVTKFMESAVFVRLNSDDPALLGVMQYYKTVPNHYNQHQVYFSKRSELLKILNMVDYNQCLVFSNYQFRSESIANDLNFEKFPTACITAGMDQKDRLVAINKLKDFQCRVLVSTDLTCRGIDAEFVDLVINFDVPNCYETYLHRIGRGGRFGSYSAAITLVAEGSEFHSLAKIERLSNTNIACLPDPMPPNITRNPDVLRNSTIPSISSLIGTKNIRQITPENVSEICKTHSDENIGQADLSQNSFTRANSSEFNEDSTETDKTLNFQDIDCKGLLKGLFDARNSVTPTSRISLTDLFDKFDAIHELSTDEEKSSIINAIKRIGKADVSTNQEPSHLLKDSISPNINFKKLVNDYFSNNFGDAAAILDALLKVIPEKKVELEKVFQTKETDSYDKLQAVMKSSEGNSDEVVEFTGTANKMQKILIKYSSKELLDVKKAMPDSCNDLSHINCDITLLTELKKGQYSRVLPFNPPKKFSGRRFKESSMQNGGQPKVSYEELKSSCEIGCHTLTSAGVLVGDKGQPSLKDKLPTTCNSETKIEGTDTDQVPMKELEIAPLAETSIDTEKSEFAQSELQFSSVIKCEEPSLTNLSAEVSQGKVNDIQREELQNILPIKPSEFTQGKVCAIVICDLTEATPTKISENPPENNGLAEKVLSNLSNKNVASEKLEIVQANSSDITSSEMMNSCHFSSVDSSDIPSDSGKAEVDENHLSLKCTNAGTEYNSKKHIGNDGDTPFSFRKKSANIKNKAHIPYDSATSFDSTSATKTKKDRSLAPKINLHRKATGSRYLSPGFSSDDSSIDQGLKVNHYENVSKVQLNSVNWSPKSAPKNEMKETPTTRNKTRYFDPILLSQNKKEQSQNKIFEDLIAQSQRMYKMAKVHTDYICQLIELNKCYQP